MGRARVTSAALALHELATNAAKHGALSSMAGKIRLTWELRPDLLVLRWIETGGPRIAPPAARSFGLKVIRASIEKQLNGKATFEWDPPGMQCTLSIPQRQTVTAREPRKVPPGAENGSAQANGPEARCWWLRTRRSSP
jgi:two-component sensor histidine kinase